MEVWKVTVIENWELVFHFKTHIFSGFFCNIENWLRIKMIEKCDFLSSFFHTVLEPFVECRTFVPKCQNKWVIKIVRKSGDFFSSSSRAELCLDWLKRIDDWNLFYMTLKRQYLPFSWTVLWQLFIRSGTMIFLRSNFLTAKVFVKCK